MIHIYDTYKILLNFHSNSVTLVLLLLLQFYSEEFRNAKPLKSFPKIA